MIHVDIFGGRVSRDIFRYEGHEEYKVNRCIGNIPISELHNKKLNIKHEIVDHLEISKYSKKMLNLQLRGNPADLLKESKAKFLIIDLADECMKRYSLGDGTDGTIAVQEEDEEKFEEMVKSYISNDVPINKYTLKDISEEEIYQNYKRFAKEIVRSEENPEGYEEKNIIVIETRYTSSVLAEKSLSLHNYETDYKIKEKNDILDKVYKILYQCIPDCRVIRFPEFTFSSETHIRGKHPLSYNEDTYDYYIQALKILTGKSRRNSIDNLFKEQCLKNRLQTRLLNAGAIYRIKPLEKEVAALKKEVEKLKKENAKLKKQK